MKKIYLLAGLWAALFSSNAQQVATFDDVELESGSWYNGADGAGGFNSGGFWFPNDYDFTWNSWRDFAVSNMKDSITSGYQNQYSAITASGAAGSGNYAVAYCPGDITMQFDPAVEVTGFDVTNSTYAYLNMRDGDGSFSKIFGGTDGSDPDYFKLLVSGLDQDGIPTDTLEFFLADFRFEDSSMDYILKTWKWFDISSLGKVKTLYFSMRSSDVGDYGMNTPAYFCMDNFTSAELTSGGDYPAADRQRLTIFPNPVEDIFFVDVPAGAERMVLLESTGRVIFRQMVSGGERLAVDVLSGMPGGIYFLVMKKEGKVWTEKVMKN